MVIRTVIVTGLLFCNWAVVSSAQVDPPENDPPRVKLKDVYANVDNAPDGEEYVTTLIKNDAKLMLYAGKFDTSFKLYITYNDGIDWIEARWIAVPKYNWEEIGISFALADPSLVPQLQVQNPYIEFAPIDGIKVTTSDASGETPLLTIMRSQVSELSLTLGRGEFEDPEVLTVESQIEWRKNLDWPESNSEDLVLYTVGQSGTVPLAGQFIPMDFPLAANEHDPEGAFEVYSDRFERNGKLRVKRCSGSWGIHTQFVDFPLERLQDNQDHCTATAILVDIDKLTGNIIAMDDFSYEFPEDEQP